MRIKQKFSPSPDGELWWEHKIMANFSWSFIPSSSFIGRENAAEFEAARIPWICIIFTRLSSSPGRMGRFACDFSRFLTIISQIEMQIKRIRYHSLAPDPLYRMILKFSWSVDLWPSYGQNQQLGHESWFFGHNFAKNQYFKEFLYHSTIQL